MTKSSLHWCAAAVSLACMPSETSLCIRSLGRSDGGAQVVRLVLLGLVVRPLCQAGEFVAGDLRWFVAEDVVREFFHQRRGLAGSRSCRVEQDHERVVLGHGERESIPVGSPNSAGELSSSEVFRVEDVGGHLIGKVHRVERLILVQAELDRIRTAVHDASAPELPGRYDLVTIFEALHDMNHPVEALQAIRASLTENGCVIVADEKVAERFTPNGDELERFNYGWSVLHCLAVGLLDSDSAGNGTVLRPDTLRRYAADAGFTRVDVLPIDNPFWQFYQLRP
jgi:hypothetical protein